MPPWPALECMQGCLHMQIPEGAVAQTPRPLRTAGRSSDWHVSTRARARKRGAVIEISQRGEQDRASETDGDWLMVRLRDGRALARISPKGEV